MFNYGESIEVTFTPDPNCTYTYTVKVGAAGTPGAPQATTGTISIEAAPADVVEIAITQAAKPTATIALDANLGAGATITFDPANVPGTFNVGDTAVFTLTAPTATPNIVKVWYTVAGEVGQNVLTPNADGKYEINVTAEKAITVWMTAVAANYVLTVDQTSVTDITIANDGTDVPFDGTGDVTATVDFGKSVVISSTNGQPLYITVAAGATAGEDLTITGEGTGTVTISNLYKAAEITVTNTAPAP